MWRRKKGRRKKRKKTPEHVLKGSMAHIAFSREHLLDGHSDIDFLPDHTLNNVNEEEPYLQNTVSVMKTGKRIDQVTFLQVMTAFEFQRDRFAATTTRLYKNATGLLYNTGNFILVGTPSKLEAHIVTIMYLIEIGRIKERIFARDVRTGRYCAIQFRPLSEMIKINPLKIANTVYKCHFEKDSISLDETYENNLGISSYQPESFPGLRIHGKEATLLAFNGGSNLILGIPDPNRIMFAYEELNTYRKKSMKTLRSKNALSNYYNDILTGVRNARGFRTRTTSEAYDREKFIYPKTRTKGTFVSSAETTRSSFPKKTNQHEKRVVNKHSHGTYSNCPNVIEDGLEQEVLDRLSYNCFIRGYEPLMTLLDSF